MGENPNFYSKSRKPGCPQKLSRFDVLKARRAINSGQCRDAMHVQRELFQGVCGVHTVRRRLCEEGLNGRVRRSKPFLSKNHMGVRLIFAKFLHGWKIEQWQFIIFSDETKINLFGSDG